MAAPADVAKNVEIVGEFEPLLAGISRASSLRPTRRARRPNVLVRGSFIGLWEGDPVSTAWDSFDVVWSPEFRLEVSNGDLTGFGERVGVFVPHLFGSNSPIFQDAQNACRSLSGGNGK